MDRPLCWTDRGRGWWFRLRMDMYIDTCRDRQNRRGGARPAGAGVLHMWDTRVKLGEMVRPVGRVSEGPPVADKIGRVLI